MLQGGLAFSPGLLAVLQGGQDLAVPWQILAVLQGEAGLLAVPWQILTVLLAVLQGGLAFSPGLPAISPCILAVHSRRASGRAGSRRAFSPCFRLGWISPGLGKFSGRFSPCLLAVLQGGLAFSPCLPGVSPGLLALLQGGPDLPGHLLNSCRAFLHPFRASMWASSCPACSRRAQNSRRAFSPCFRVGSSCRRLARILPQEGTRSSIWLTSLVDLPLDPVCKSTIGPSKVGQDILHHV